VTTTPDCIAVARATPPKCPDRPPVAASVIQLFNMSKGNTSEVFIETIDTGLMQLPAPYPAAELDLRLVCDGNSEIVLPADGSYDTKVVGGNALSLKCFINKTEQAAKWDVDVSKVRCRCRPGFKQGTGAKIAECIDCRDGTFAPLNDMGSRAECRACPREGVDCTEGRLTILKDFWYDVEATESFDVGGVRGLKFDDEGKQGLRPTTKMYKCMQR
jgi:hypothetical protein